MVKMVIVDLDGTLLGKDSKVSSDTKNYLGELKDNGYIITIATGRIYASALKAKDGAGFANYIISDTGTCIYDTSSEIAIFKNPIAKDTAGQSIRGWNQ